MNTRIEDKLRNALTMLTVMTVFAVSTALAQKPELIVQATNAAWIQSVAFSMDGRILASGGSSGTVQLWDLESSRLIRSIEMTPAIKFEVDEDPQPPDSEDQLVNLFERIDGGGVAETVYALAFSPDKKSLAIGSTNKTIILLDLVTGAKRTLDQTNRVWFITFSKDSSTLLSIGNDRSYRYWDVASGMTLKDVPSPSMFNLPWVSPDGKLTARYSEDRKTIEILDPAGKQIRILEGHGAGVRQVSFSPNGNLLASCSWDRTVRLWDMRGDAKPKVLTGHTSFVSAVSFSADGKRLASASGDSTIKVWDVESGNELTSLFGYTKYVTPHAFGQDDKTLVTAIDNLMHVWDLTKGRKLGAIQAHIGDINLMVFSPNKKLLATTDETHINIEQFAEMTKLLATNELVAKYIPWLPRLMKIDTLPDLDSSNKSQCSDMEIKLWDMETRTPVQILRGHTSEISLLAFNPKGEILASSGGDGNIKIWDVKTGKEQFTFTVGKRNAEEELGIGKVLQALDQLAGCGSRSRSEKGISVISIAFSPAGDVLASIDEDGNIKLWNVRTGQELKTFSIGQGAEGRALIFRDDKTLVSVDRNEIFKLWNLDTYKLEDVFSLREIEKVKVLVDSIPDIPAPLRTANRKFRVEEGNDGKYNRVEIYDNKTDKPLAWLITLDKDNWVVVTPDGRFDTNELEDSKGLSWVAPDAPVTPLPLDIFMRDYYEPQLLPRLLRCTEEGDCNQEFKSIRDITNINRTQPQVTIKEVVPSGADTVQVTLEVASTVSQSQTDAQGRALQSGVFDVRLFRDGQMVGNSTAELPLENYIKVVGRLERTPEGDAQELNLWRQANQVKLDDKGRATLTFSNIKLPQSGAVKEVEFSAYSFNSDRVKSKTVRRSYSLPNVSQPRKGRAYIITVGVNANENPNFNLKYAANDAAVMERVVTKELLAGGQYEEVVSVSLISDWRRKEDGQIQVLEAKATKENFAAVLQLLSNKAHEVPAERRSQLLNADKLRPATPEDLVIILFSSHGYAAPGGEFYMIPYNTGEAKGINSSFLNKTLALNAAGVAQADKERAYSFLQSCISSDELSLWLRDVDAGHMTLIVDACYSAAAVESSGFKPGPMGSRGLGQLAYDKGIRILTASQADSEAWEACETKEGQPIKHGLLTYTLTKKGLEDSLANLNNDQNILISEWLEYGADHVPELYKSMNTTTSEAGESQKELCKEKLIELRPVSDKPTDKGEPLRKIQQPALFDFTRRRNDVALAWRR